MKAMELSAFQKYYWRKIASLTMSACQADFERTRPCTRKSAPFRSEELPYQPRLARNRFQVSTQSPFGIRFV